MTDEERQTDGRDSEDAELPLIAYLLEGAAPMPIVPASYTRPWMDEIPDRFAHRCLPMTIANQAGWMILNSHTFRVVWHGGPDLASLEMIYLDGAPPYPALSNFGHGILTFHIPYIFRTPPGYNLLARGPANSPKDGISALEGLVETDWAISTFTMNWQMTRPNQVVEFERGEPICMVVPQRRGELEEFSPATARMTDDADLAHEHVAWSQSRTWYNATKQLTGVGKPDGVGWQRHYFRGKTMSGGTAPEHQTRLTLRPFVGMPD